MSGFRALTTFTLALALTGAGLVSCRAADKPAGKAAAQAPKLLSLKLLPLADLTVVGGRKPMVKAIQGGFLIQNGATVRARVAMPADAYPCRLSPGADRDVVQLCIGRPTSLLANAMFSPRADLAVEFDASHVELAPGPEGYRLTAAGPVTVKYYPAFMKTQRGDKWYAPIQATPFKHAPAGWCTWYIYWQGITEAEVVKNTDWLAKHLAKFGCRYVQIDDGWQGVGHGNGENRDWYVTDKAKFPHGMGWLARYIKSKGFKPGLWLIPFATSNEELFKQHPDMFCRRADGTSVGETVDKKGKVTAIDWTGRFIVDSTSKLGQKWFHDLFHMIIDDWGYDYVKIDGQGGSRGLPATVQAQLADPKLPPDQVYRKGLAAIKDVMGPGRFLLNCGGQWDSAGYCDGIRIGGDVGPSWAGMQPAISSTMANLYHNNLDFWTDPDVVCVRPAGQDGSSLTFDQAQLWTTLVGITGQLLMSSDRMYALPEDRVELLRRIYPVADIHPMDLYSLPGRPRIFDLRIAKPGVGDWDVVAVFNWDDAGSASVRLQPRDLGLPGGRYLYYDAWGKKLLASSDQGLALSLAPMSCRLIVVRPFLDHPELLGTSRHITQGAEDLVSANWDAKTTTWSGRSKVVGGDPYEIRFSLPPGWSIAPGSAAARRGPVALLTLRRPDNGEMSWKVGFRKAAVAAAAVAPTVSDASVKQVGGGIHVTWKGGGAISYSVYRNGQLLGQVDGTELTDSPQRRGVTYRYEVAADGWAGSSRRLAAGEVTLKPPPRGTAPDAWLQDLQPVTARQDYGQLQHGRSVDGHPLRIGGVTYAHGLGTHANGRIRYRLDNRYARFEAMVGVDDEKGGAGTVDFQVLVDGDKVFDSGVMKGGQAAKKVDVPLKGVEMLDLVVTDGGDGINCDHADWADARLIGNR